jgi:type III secretion protein J
MPRLWLWPLLLLVGCTAPVASDLPESDANQALVALEKQGISASKERDPEGEGTFRVLVAKDDASSAAIVLTQENLPPRPSPGVLEAVGKSGMVPSRSSEHARLVAGTSGDLERSLRALDGVVSARVHLAVPPRDALALGEDKPTTTASVLVRHRGATPPIAPSDIQRLVAGAVPGLSAEQVSVVMTPSPAHARPAERGLSQFGPLSVTQSSLTPLRLMVGSVILVNVALIGCLLLLWARLRRTEAQLAEVRPLPEAGAQAKR